MATSTAGSSSNSITSTLYSSGKYSDFTITCRGIKFKVHKAVVCLQSKPLAAAVDGKFKEAITGEIDLEDDERDVVANMLNFLYTTTYDDGRKPAPDPAPILYDDTLDWDGWGAPKKKKGLKGGKGVAQSPSPAPNPAPAPSTPESSDAALLINAKMYVVAAKYDIQPLKELAKKKYEEVVAYDWNGASFAASLKLLYEGTVDKDRLLKDVAINAAGEHAKELVDRGEFVALCREKGDIAFDVLKASLSLMFQKQCPFCSSKHGSRQRITDAFFCPSCHRNFN